MDFLPELIFFVFVTTHEIYLVATRFNNNLMQNKVEGETAQTERKFYYTPETLG